MKKRWLWHLTLALALLGGSTAVYVIHYLIFHDLHHIFIYLIGDIAFLFITILFVTVVFENVLARREKKALLKKMNMVIGAFFSALGRDLLVKFPELVENTADLAPRLVFGKAWTRGDYAAAMESARTFAYKVRVTPASLRDLRACLLDNRVFLLGLLENPNLLEHEGFTDLLWAVFHLAEELEMRPESLEGLPAADYAHLAVDVKRAYALIAREWLAYARHLQESYPFLFALAVRINPFSPTASAIVQN
jgi:hypothetical protein